VLDPLGQYLPPEPFPTSTPAPTGPFADKARTIYSSAIGIEFMHIPGAAEREWLATQMERVRPAPDRAYILSRLIHADLFEQTIQSRYLGTKRFSLEGLTVLIPFLDTLLNSSSALGVETAVLAMSHRGRLNVMTNTIGRSPAEIFARFEDVNPAQRTRRRRRQVPHGRHRRLSHARRPQPLAAPRLQPQPS